jgi:fatty acid desaturase
MPKVSPEVTSSAASATGEEFRVDERGVDGRSARQLLTPSELRELTILDDRLGLIAPLLTFSLSALFVLLGWLALRDGAWLLLILALIGIATQQHALFVLAHEAAHYRMLKSRVLNDFFGRIAGTLGGVSMCTYRVTHRLHHNHLYGTQDPDIALNGGYPRGGWYLLKKLLIDLTGWTAPKTYAYFFGAPAINSDNSERLNPLNDTSEALRKDARLDRWTVVAFHVLMPILCFFWGSWFGLAAYLLLWVLPLITFLQVILRLRAVAEHGAPGGYDSPLRAARTNLSGAGPLGWIIRFVFFPHHVNYHIEHHLYPAIPHYRLKATHQLLMAKGALQGAEVRLFTDTLKRVFMPKGSLPEALRARTAPPNDRGLKDQTLSDQTLSDQTLSG